MSYQVFARKYRPQSFDEVLGQEAVVKTLKNAITYSRVHQAYLFCGARGVGKTSLARIFTKSLNCEKGATLAPCQECASCKGITLGNSLDVLEIDGASNTGVDDVRELREQVKYLPTNGKYKIYIIDEVHMLSQSAFNALLKTLEEPPQHVIFVFATTEPHKIPITILSRCQRFDFKRLSILQLVAHLKKVLATERLTIPEESLTLIAQCSEGSVRDSLSLLDQIVSYCGQEVSIEKVREILGLSDAVVLLDMLEAILKGEAQKVLKQAQEVYQKGSDLKIFSEGLLNRVHQLLLVSEGGLEGLEISQGEKDFLKKLIPFTDTSRLMLLFQALARGIEDLARSDFPKMVFEVTLMKMIRVKEILSISEILENLKISGSGVSQPLATSSLRGGQEIKRPPPIPLQRAAARPSVSQVEAKSKESQTTGEIPKMWRDFVKKVSELKPQVGSILEHAVPLKIEGGGIVIGFEPQSLYSDMLKERITVLQEVAQDFFKKPMQFDIQTLQAGSSAIPTALQMRYQEEKRRSDEVTAKALANPLVQRAQEMLGAKVKEVKEIK